MGKMVLKENLESRVPPVKKESAEQMGQVVFLGFLVRCLLRTGKSAPGKTWMITKTMV